MIFLAVGPALITTDPNKLLKRLDEITVGGGGDCPEKCLSGIKIALEKCLPGSFVYVFTDANENDSHLLPNVLSLLQEKRTSVICFSFFL